MKKYNFQVFRAVRPAIFSLAVLVLLLPEASPALTSAFGSVPRGEFRHHFVSSTGVFANNDPANWTDPDGRFGKAAWDTTKAIAGSPQFQGGMKLGGGVGLMVVGAGGVLTPEPTMLSKAGGIAGIGVGADFAATGWNEMRGKSSQTLTAQAVAAGVQGAGFQPSTANRIAEYTQSGIETILPFGVVGKAGAVASATGKQSAKALNPAAVTSVTQLNATELKLSRRVEGHLADLSKHGTLARPYGDSRLLMREIMEAKPPVPDPGGVSGGLRWDVQGTMNRAQGAYELVVDPKTNTVLHFLFKKQ